MKFKLLFTFMITLLALNVFAMTDIISVKERLRLSLWFEGLDSSQQQKSKVPATSFLPEELEVPLKKMK